jgi:ubiquinone/menaquinone biosynthesis C-methylase UbiE
MGFYADRIFPYLMDWTLSRSRFRLLRQEALASAYGLVLEIGFGTGLNLPHYPRAVTKLTVLDPAVLLPTRVARRIAAASTPVEVTRLSAEALPFEDHRFDCVVSTFTLCTIPDPTAALKEVQRVMKPEATFMFLEHGRSDDARVAAWQDFFNPLQQRLACGCNLNRPIDALIRGAGLQVARLDRFRLPGVPRIVGELYRGRATSERAEGG